MKRRETRLPELIFLLLALALTACGQKKAPPAMEELWESMAARTKPSELTALGERELRNRLGLEKENYPQALVLVSGDPMALDEVWLLECADEETARETEALAERHRESLCRQSRDYDPRQYVLAEKARVCREGVYLGFFLGAEAEEMEEIFLRAVK